MVVSCCHGKYALLLTVPRGGVGHTGRPGWVRKPRSGGSGLSCGFLRKRKARQGKQASNLLVLIILGSLGEGYPPWDD